MPQINRIRVNNVKYNFGTQMYDDFMMRPNCSSMIYDLANGGGKSLLMLMLLQNVIPNCTLDEKQPVEKLFRQGGGNTVIHSLVEWKLEPCYRKDNYTYMTTGFCARKAGAQSNSSGIEYFNYAIFYREFGDNDIKNLPLTSNGERITYNGLKEYLRNLEKDDFNVSVKIFDRKGDYQNFLSHYGIYESQWEIIRGINKTEGHVRTYFESNYRTSRKVVEDLLIEEIIEKSFNNKLGVTDDEGQMARTLLDIKDKLLELSKKNSQIGNYNSQVEEIEKFAQYAESFKVNFIKKQELEEKIYRLLCACKIIIADREALSEQNSSDLEKIQEKINNEQYLIQSAQVASEQKSLDAIRELVDVYSAKIEAADSRFAERKELLRKSESVNDYADYLKYENDFNKIKQTIDNRMREHDDITAELHDIAVKIFELSNDEREKLKESLKQSQKELQTAEDNYKEAQKTFDSLTKEEAAAQSLVSFLKSRIENDEKQMAVLMEKCGIIIAENVEAELLTSEENIKDARQEIQQKDKAYNDLKLRLGDTQTDIARIDVGLEFIKKEIEDVKKIQAEYEQTKDKLNTLSKIYNDENTAGLDIKIKEYSDSLDSEYFEAEKEAQRLAAFIENAKKHQYLLDAKNRTKLKEYLFTRYKDDVKEGADWLAQLDEKQRTDVKRRIPFVEYSFIVKNNFDKIKNDATLASFNLDSYTVPIVSEDNVLDAKVQIDKNTVVFAMKDMDFLKDDAKTESEIAAAQEELDNINHKIEGKLRIGSFSSVTAMWMPEVIHYFNRNYPQVEVQIFDGNYDEIRDWIIHGQVDCGFLSSIVADNLKFYPLCEDPLCAVMQKNHPLAEKKSVRLEELLEYPFIIETPGCDNDILHLLERCGKEPKTSYSFRDDTLIMAFVKNGLGVTISQKLVMKAFANDVESRPLEPGRSRIIGLAFVKTMNSVVTKILLEYLKGMM